MLNLYIGFPKGRKESFVKFTIEIPPEGSVKE